MKKENPVNIEDVTIGRIYKNVNTGKEITVIHVGIYPDGEKAVAFLSRKDPDAPCATWRGALFCKNFKEV